MTTATVQMVDKRIVCQKGRTHYTNPGRDNFSNESAARAVGWIVWEGSTIGGREEWRVFCPPCAGNGPEPVEEDGEPPRWDARCDTCDWAASDEDEYEDGQFTEDDARAWKSEHRCEPDVKLITPKPKAAS